MSLPTPLATFPELGAYVESQWRAHVADGFAELARTPSGALQALIESLRAEPGLCTVESLMELARGDENSDVRRRMQQPPGLAFMGAGGPVFLRKAYLAEAIKRAPDDATREAFAAELASLAGVDTPKAPQVRSALNAVLKDLLGQKLASRGGGEWALDLDFDGTPVKLWVDTGGMARGFRYELWPPRRPGEVMPVRINCETVLGLPGFAWDALRTDRLDEQVAMWSGRLRELLEAMKEIRWPHAG